MPEAKKFPFKLGADPEFNFIVQNRHSGRLRADSLMKDFFSDKRSANSGYEIKGGNAGWDGNAATGEIRPKPADSPAGLAENIGNIYREISKRSPRAVKMSVRSDTAPVGGHIHFELDHVSSAMSDQKARIVQKRLSTFYTPIALGDDPANLALRTQTSYGKFNDWRRKNGITYEYRTPSAEWQLTPKICEATLAYLGTIWFEAVHRPESFKNFDAIYPNDKAGNSIQQLIISGYKPIERIVVNDIKKMIKGFEFYPMFKDEIDYILNFKKVLKDKKATAFCINLGWDFQETSSPTKKLINNEAKIRKSLNNIDIDRWMELFKIPHNPDTNVKDFVDALKRRILAYDWNLKNEYYMFGMRKGIKKPIVMNGNYQFIIGQDQIKTIRDRDIMIDTFRRMKGRMNRATRATAANSIIIGLPYAPRMKKDIKPIMEMVYDIEKNPGDYTPMVPKSDELIDDVGLPAEQWGTIAQAFNVSDVNPIEIEENNRFSADLTDTENEDACPQCGAPNHDCDC